MFEINQESRENSPGLTQLQEQERMLVSLASKNVILGKSNEWNKRWFIQMSPQYFITNIEDALYAVEQIRSLATTSN